MATESIVFNDYTLNCINLIFNGEAEASYCMEENMPKLCNGRVKGLSIDDEQTTNYWSLGKCIY